MSAVILLCTELYIVSRDFVSYDIVMYYIKLYDMILYDIILHVSYDTILCNMILVNYM